MNRIYGVYPGHLEPGDIENLTDFDLFFNYYSANKFIQDMHQEKKDGGISEEEWPIVEKEAQERLYAREYLTYVICQKHGIDVSKPEPGKNIQPDSTLFMRWYHFYNNHLMGLLKTEDDWSEFEQKYLDGEDMSKYIPKGSWRREEPK